MQTLIAPNFPHKLPCGGALGYARARDGFGRSIIYISVKPRNGRGWTAPCDNWRIARVYAEGLAQHGVPGERGAA